MSLFAFGGFLPPEFADRLLHLLFVHADSVFRLRQATQCPPGCLARETDRYPDEKAVNSPHDRVTQHFYLASVSDTKQPSESC